MALSILCSCPWPTQHALAAQPAFDVLGILAHHQPVTNELAGGAVLHALEGEDGVFAHPGRHLLKLGCAAHRQRLEHGTLNCQELRRTGVHALHDGVDERFVVTARLEAAAAAQPQGLVQCGLEGVVARFDGAVLVGLPRVAATGPQAHSGGTGRRSAG